MVLGNVGGSRGGLTYGPCVWGRPRIRPGARVQAACASAAISAAKAWAIQGIRSWTSAVSTVEPHQMRRPGGRVAVGAHVEARAGLLDPLGDGLGKGLAIGDARVGELEADRGGGRRRRVFGQVRDPGVLRAEVVDDLGVGIGAGDQARAARRWTSPISARQGNPRSPASRAC
jgi:hypothetical protein